VTTYLALLGSALWLGVLTSISPCPLATNIAAVSFVGQRVGNPWKVLAAGGLYALGRALVYAGLCLALVYGLARAPVVSHYLQKYMNQAMGPLLILVGMVLLGLISLPGTGASLGDRVQRQVERMGTWGALVLGVIFALAFCPVSAALYFGSLLPIAFRSGAPLPLAILYGVGTALPVLFFAVVLTFGARSLARIFDMTGAVERWARRVTGVVFLFLGVYFSLVFVFRVPLPGI
jgi:cytochrome c-type biogenesis protein